MAGSKWRLVGVVFVVLAAILNFISFVSPYWMVSDSRARNQFQRIGLWEACLKDYRDPKDYVSKLYNGCWWIFWPEYREIRYWLNPSWFQGLQAVAVINFIVTILAAIVVVMGLKNGGLISVLVSFLLSSIDSILMGLGSIDRTWMPRADYNFLSWGFWLHVLGGFFAFISFVSLLTNSVNDVDDDDSDNGRKY